MINVVIKHKLYIILSTKPSFNVRITTLPKMTLSIQDSRRVRTKIFEVKF